MHRIWSIEASIELLSSAGTMVIGKAIRQHVRGKNEAIKRVDSFEVELSNCDRHCRSSATAEVWTVPSTTFLVVGS
jgi:hypothetical protein